jgi:hypothetical protein
MPQCDPRVDLLCEEQPPLLFQLHRRTLLRLEPNLPGRPMRNTVYGGRRQLYGEHLLLRSVLRRHLLRFGPDLPQQSDVLRTCERLRLDLSDCSL